MRYAGVEYYVKKVMGSVYQLFTELSTAPITAMKLLFLQTLLESN